MWLKLFFSNWKDVNYLSIKLYKLKISFKSRTVIVQKSCEKFVYLIYILFFVVFICKNLLTWLWVFGWSQNSFMQCKQTILKCPKETTEKRLMKYLSVLSHNKSYILIRKDLIQILLTFVSTSRFLTDCINFSVVVPLALSYKQEQE